jgi:putative oxidoreductase
LQRLFTTFADGWPGFGLLIQRLVAGTALLLNGLTSLREMPGTGILVPEIAGALLGLLMLAGLWTPVAGALVAAVEVWIALAGRGDIWIPLMLAALGGTLAMIGPGAWSIDARLFGRKHIGN